MVLHCGSLSHVEDTQQPLRCGSLSQVDVRSCTAVRGASTSSQNKGSGKQRAKDTNSRTIRPSYSDPLSLVGSDVLVREYPLAVLERLALDRKKAHHRRGLRSKDQLALQIADDENINHNSGCGLGEIRNLLSSSSSLSSDTPNNIHKNRHNKHVPRRILRKIHGKTDRSAQVCPNCSGNLTYLYISTKNQSTTVCEVHNGNESTEEKLQNLFPPVCKQCKTHLLYVRSEYKFLMMENFNEWLENGIDEDSGEDEVTTTYNLNDTRNAKLIAIPSATSFGDSRSGEPPDKTPPDATPRRENTTNSKCTESHQFKVEDNEMQEDPILSYLSSLSDQLLCEAIENKSGTEQLEQCSLEMKLDESYPSDESLKVVIEEAKAANNEVHAGNLSERSQVVSPGYFSCASRLGSQSPVNPISPNKAYRRKEELCYEQHGDTSDEIQLLEHVTAKMEVSSGNLPEYDSDIAVEGVSSSDYYSANRLVEAKESTMAKDELPLGNDIPEQSNIGIRDDWVNAYSYHSDSDEDPFTHLLSDKNYAPGDDDDECSDRCGDTDQQNAEFDESQDENLLEQATSLDENSSGSIKLIQTASEERVILESYSMKKKIATLQIAKNLMRGHELTTSKCNRCGMPTTTKDGTTAVCRTCPAIERKAKKRAKQKRKKLCEGRCDRQNDEPPGTEVHLIDVDAQSILDCQENEALNSSDNVEDAQNLQALEEGRLGSSSSAENGMHQFPDVCSDTNEQSHWHQQPSYSSVDLNPIASNQSNYWVQHSSSSQQVTTCHEQTAPHSSYAHPPSIHPHHSTDGSFPSHQEGIIQQNHHPNGHNNQYHEKSISEVPELQGVSPTTLCAVGVLSSDMTIQQLQQPMAMDEPAQQPYLPLRQYIYDSSECAPSHVSNTQQSHELPSNNETVYHKPHVTSTEAEQQLHQRYKHGLKSSSEVSDASSTRCPHDLPPNEMIYRPFQPNYAPKEEGEQLSQQQVNETSSSEVSDCQESLQLSQTLEEIIHLQSELNVQKELVVQQLSHIQNSQEGSLSEVSDYKVSSSSGEESLTRCPRDLPSNEMIWQYGSRLGSSAPTHEHYTGQLTGESKLSLVASSESSEISQTLLDSGDAGQHAVDLHIEESQESQDEQSMEIHETESEVSSDVRQIQVQLTSLSSGHVPSNDEHYSPEEMPVECINDLEGVPETSPLHLCNRIVRLKASLREVSDQLPPKDSCSSQVTTSPIQNRYKSKKDESKENAETIQVTYDTRPPTRFWQQESPTVTLLGSNSIGIPITPVNIGVEKNRYNFFNGNERYEYKAASSYKRHVHFSCSQIITSPEKNCSSPQRADPPGRVMKPCYAETRDPPDVYNIRSMQKNDVTPKSQRLRSGSQKSTKELGRVELNIVNSSATPRSQRKHSDDGRRESPPDNVTPKARGRRRSPSAAELAKISLAAGKACSSPPSSTLSWEADEPDVTLQKANSFGDSSLGQLFQTIDEIEDDFHTIMSSLPCSEDTTLSSSVLKSSSNSENWSLKSGNDKHSLVEITLDNAGSFESADTMVTDVMERMRRIKDCIEHIDSAEDEVEGSTHSNGSQQGEMTELMKRLSQAAESLRELHNDWDD